MRTTVLIAALAAFASLPVQASELSISTGGAGNRYHASCLELQKQLKGTSLNVTCLTSKGSFENLDRIQKGEADAALVQGDAIPYFQKYKGPVNVARVQSLHMEGVHLICNNTEDISDISDLLDHPDIKVLVDKNGSGTQITWDNFVSLNPDYAQVKTEPEGGVVALNKVIDGSDAGCLVFVGGIGTKTLRDTVELGAGAVSLVEIDDSAFFGAKDAKGNPIYRSANIASGTYPGIQAGTFSTSVDTVVMDALFVASNDWIESNEADYPLLTQAVLKVKNQSK